MNTTIVVILCVNVNSTHTGDTWIMKELGGSGDFARNEAFTILTIASASKKGTISSIVPYVSLVAHTERDARLIITQQGYAGLRGLSLYERATVIIENYAHPSFKSSSLIIKILPWSFRSLSIPEIL